MAGSVRNPSMWGLSGYRVCSVYPSWHVFLVFWPLSP